MKSKQTRGVFSGNSSRDRSGFSGNRGAGRGGSRNSFRPNQNEEYKVSNDLLELTQKEKYFLRYCVGKYLNGEIGKEFENKKFGNPCYILIKKGGTINSQAIANFISEASKIEEVKGNQTFKDIVKKLLKLVIGNNNLLASFSEQALPNLFNGLSKCGIVLTKDQQKEIVKPLITQIENLLKNK